MQNEDGTIAHGELVFEGGVVMVSTTRDEESRFPGGPVTIDAAMDDVDAHHERAVAAGAEVVMELTDQEYGSREYAIRDPGGNVWTFGTPPSPGRRIAADLDTVRRLALARRATRGAPLVQRTASFRVKRGTMFAREREDGESIALKIDPGEREALVARTSPRRSWSRRTTRTDPWVIVRLAGGGPGGARRASPPRPGG